MNYLFLFLIYPLLSCTSCSLLTRPGNWGRRPLWPIRASRIGSAIRKNAGNPHVWLPVVGAGIAHWGGYDRPISKAVVQEKAIYNNKTNTGHWSDQFNDILLYQMYGSILLTSSMGEDESLSQWALNKTKGGLVVNLASSSTRYARGQLAKSFRRQRPNRSDHMSFPSGHSTEAGSRNMLVAKNLDSIEMHPYLRTGIKSINTMMAVGTLWARLEGENHYPSDVLMGYALGSFVAGVVYDSLMNLDDGEVLTIVPLPNEVALRYSMQF